MKESYSPVQWPDAVDHDRRALLLLALAGVSAPALAKAGDPMAMGASIGTRPAGHLMTKVLGEKPSRIPGFAKITLAALTYQPGDKIEFTMASPAICQVTQGRLEAERAGESFIVNTGDFWSCNTGDKCFSINRGPGIAVMRYFSLLPG